jgi:hypothetical protein
VPFILQNLWVGCGHHLGSLKMTRASKIATVITSGRLIHIHRRGFSFDLFPIIVGTVCSGQLIPDTTLSFSSATAGGNPPLN